MDQNVSVVAAVKGGTVFYHMSDVSLIQTVRSLWMQELTDETKSAEHRGSSFNAEFRS